MNWFQALSLFVQLWPIIERMLGQMSEEEKTEAIVIVKALIAANEKVI